MTMTAYVNKPSLDCIEHPPLVIGNNQRIPWINSIATRPPITKEKRNRAGKPKTKTGCQTCRTRHVKCDEAKPSCNRCIKFGTECDGYSNTRVRGSPIQTQRSFLLPKRPVPIPRATITRLDVGPRFESDLELRYFRVFCDQIAAEITIPYKSSLWNRLIPQASEIHPFVRHAVVAIGAMSKSSGGTMQSGDNRSLNSEHLYALQQYDKALRGMRKALELGKHNVRDALIACLLAFCFETLQGRQGPACALASSGMELFYKWRDENESSKSSTARQALEDDLIYAFGSLDLQVLLFLDQRPLDLHQKAINKYNQALRLMPLKFSSLKAVCSCWQLIMKRNLHFKAKAQIMGKAADLGGEIQDPGWPDTADFDAGAVPFSAVKEPSPEIQAECAEYVEDVHRWSRAAANVFSSILPLDQASVLGATLLKIQAHMNVITIAGMSFTSETRFDAFLTEFHAILTLSSSIHAQLISSSKESGLYRFDLGIIPALYLVGSRCRDRRVRSQAIDLLHSSPYREGIWDSGAVWAISNWLRNIEEESLGPNDDYIPEHKRAFLTSGTVDLYNRRGNFQCTQRHGSHLGFREATLTW